MANSVNAVSKERKVLTLKEAIMFQLLYYSFFNEYDLTNSQLSLITFLYYILSNKEYSNGVPIPLFCKLAKEEGLYKSTQSVRNAINTINKSTDFIVLEGDGKKRLYINDKLQVMTNGNIFLNYKLLYLDR